MDQLSGLGVKIAGANRGLNAWPVVVCGVDSTGTPQPIGVATSGGGIPVTPAAGVGTYTYFHVANSGSLSGGIPVTALRWGVNFVGTGTANTFGTNTSLTGGQSFSDSAAPTVAIVIACDASTVADGFYSTT